MSIYNGSSVAYTSQAQEYAILLREEKKITVFKYIQKGNRKVFNLNPVPKGKNKKSNSMNAAFITNNQKFH